MTKQFKVVARASKCNSFGLRGIVLLARDGEGWEVGANEINDKKMGEVLDVPLSEIGEPMWEKFGFEIPRRYTDAPPAVIIAVFGSLLPTA
jgi:hypothetical protein